MLASAPAGAPSVADAMRQGCSASPPTPPPCRLAPPLMARGLGVLGDGPGMTIFSRAGLVVALPMEEETGLPYASKVHLKDVQGHQLPALHACGRDIHITRVLATMQLL